MRFYFISFSYKFILNGICFNCMCIIFRILFLHIFFCVFSFLCFLFQIYFVFIKYRIALFFAYDLHTYTHTIYMDKDDDQRDRSPTDTQHCNLKCCSPNRAKKQHPNVQRREFKRARQYHLTTPLHSATPARSSLS